MRVATRRLRAAIDLFADVLPVRARAFRDELGWAAGVLGRVRDLDVQQEAQAAMSSAAVAWSALFGGAEQDPLADLHALLERERNDARFDMLAALDSVRWDRLVNGMASMVKQGPLRRSSASRLPAVVAVPDLVATRHRAVAKAARRAKRSGLVSDFHRLRIRCKRLRYSLEFSAELYDGRTSRYVKQLTGLQDLLGLLQDAEVASARLAELATGEAHLPATTVFVMGGVAEHHRMECDRLLHRLPKEVSRVGGREWQELEDIMERHRSQALALLPPVRRTLRALPQPPVDAPPTETVGSAVVPAAVAPPVATLVSPPGVDATPTA
jgi:CHAD domain-containing protein